MATSTQSSSAPQWPDLPAEHPLLSLYQKLPEILAASSGYSEIWGVTLIPPPSTSTEPPKQSEPTDPDAIKEDKPVVVAPKPDFYTLLILQKFLRANSNNVSKAFLQLQETMTWRQSFFSPSGDAEKGWDDSHFEGLGYTNIIDGKVVSWNIYGATKDIKATFGDLPEFIRWRVALMEKSLDMLNLQEVKEPIPDFGEGEDKYQCVQIHDYQNVSFLRLPGEVRVASKKTIQMFGRYYPETLSQKFMINVPAIMGWVYSLLKKIVAKETMTKMEMFGDGKQLAGYLGEGLPETYGGKGKSLDETAVVVRSPKKDEPVLDEKKPIIEEHQQHPAVEEKKGPALEPVSIPVREDSGKPETIKEEDEKAPEPPKKDEELAAPEPPKEEEPTPLPVSATEHAPASADDSKATAVPEKTEAPENTAEPIPTEPETPKPEEPAATAAEEEKKKDTPLPLAPETTLAAASEEAVVTEKKEGEEPAPAEKVLEVVREKKD